MRTIVGSVPWKACLGASLLLALALAAPPAPASQDDWNCNLQVYWGALGGWPSDTADYFGVKPEATDGYDLIDSKKPAEPMGLYVYAWFERPTWGVGRIREDWRAPVAEGTTKNWYLSSITDTWNVKTNLDNGLSGYCEPTCDPFCVYKYPIAADIYIIWEFGVSELPPLPAPPDDYEFRAVFRGGLNAKPTGTGSPSGATIPATNTVFDMEITPYVVLPMWSESFGPWNTSCGYAGRDTAKFLFYVINPADPTCAIAIDPDEPRPAPATFTFAATASYGTPPYTFFWDFGDGKADTGNPMVHTYTERAIYTATCVVLDGDGRTGTCTLSVIVNLPPACAATYEPAVPFVDDIITFDAGAVDPDGGPLAVAWDFGDSHSANGATVSHAYTSEGIYTYCAIVTDDVGATATCCGDILVLPWTCVSLPGPSWHMITLPWSCVDPSPHVVFDALIPPLCPLDMLSGCLHRYNHDLQRYETYYHWAPTAFGSITPGDGYWLWAYDNTTICYRATPPGEPVTVHFPTSGWYMFGSPRAEDTPVAACTVYHAGDPPRSFTDAANVWIMDPLLFYDPGSHGYASCGVSPLDTDHHLRAFRGHWLYTFVDDVTVEIPSGGSE